MESARIYSSSTPEATTVTPESYADLALDRNR